MNDAVGSVLEKGEVLPTFTFFTWDVYGFDPSPRLG
jgi:hypothetical protein